MKRQKSVTGRWQRDKDKASFWNRKITEHERSGLSARQFCKDNDLSEASLSYWRRALNLRAEEAKAASSNPAFVPVTLVEEVPREPLTSTFRDEPIEIVTPGGFLLRITSGSNIGLLPIVLFALEGRPC